MDTEHLPDDPLIRFLQIIGSHLLEPDMPSDTALAARPQATAQLLIPLDAGSAANTAAAAHLFANFRRTAAAETRRRHDADLALFARFLALTGSTADGEQLATTPAAWQGVTWGLVEAFREWQLQQGYAIGSINVRLSTVKVYASLAAKAGTLPADQLALIRLVTGFRHAQGKRVDRTRAQTRRGTKKAKAVSVTLAQATLLKRQAASPRDQLIMAILLDHGFRVGELVALDAAAFDLDAGTLTFYRSKVDKTQTHELTADALVAALAYLPTLPNGAALFPVDRTVRTIVRDAGRAIGLEGLSPHDLRHAWATFATRAGTATKDLQDAGGWSSPMMPLAYAASAAIANTGVRLK